VRHGIEAEAGGQVAPRAASKGNRRYGGRSFVWGGSDFHDNMHGVAEYRRYLLNGIAWIAKIEVPAEAWCRRLRRNFEWA
jgi:hypothetical protein